MDSSSNEIPAGGRRLLDLHGIATHEASTTLADRLSLIATFVAVGERSSFGKAAEALSMSTSSVSRKITKLENDLGVLLFNRTTRQVALTEGGRIYFEWCQKILESISEADSIVMSMNSTPRGLLRMTSPVALGRMHISNVIADFLSHYPDVQVEASFTDQYTDLVSDEFDVAIRIGSLPDSALIARKVGTNRRLMLASRDFIAKHGTPRNPQDLARFNCLRFSRYASSGSVWQLRRGKEEEHVSIHGSFKSDNSEVIFDQVVRGVGIGIVAEYIWQGSPQRDDVVPVLSEWEVVPDAGIFVVYPNRRHLAPKVRAFVDFVAAYFDQEAALRM